MFLSAFTIAATLLSGQTIASGSTTKAVDVQQADTAFWAAFNACDRDGMADAFTEDAEFYHDVTGFTQGRAAIVASLVNGPCGTDGQHLRREVVAGTVSTYALTERYMFLTGDLFYVRQGDGVEHLSAKARFADVWRLDGERWRMARVVSYDHGPAPYVPPPVDETFELARLPALAGRYQSRDFGEVSLSVEASGLRMKSGDLSLALIPVGADRFAASDRDLQFEFDGDTLTVLQNGTPVTTARRVH